MTYERSTSPPDVGLPEGEGANFPPDRLNLWSDFGCRRSGLHFLAAIIR